MTSMLDPRDGGEPVRALPRLVLRFGVTGHRPGGLRQADPPLLCAQLDSVVQDIRASALELQRAQPGIFATGEPGCFVISSLAEGSDRIVAERALRAGCELLCPLPFEREEYARDFAGHESRTQFSSLLARAAAVLTLDGLRADPEEAYEHAGRVMLAQSDLVIAIWNGEAAAGRGGTAQMVREACAFGTPVIWIQARAPHPRTLLLQTAHHAQAYSPSLLSNELFRTLSSDLQGEARVEGLAPLASVGNETWPLLAGDSGGFWRPARPARPRVPASRRDG